MKKIIALTCAVALTACMFASCGGDSAVTDSNGSTPATSVSATSSVNVKIDEIGEASVKTPTTATAADIRVISLKLDNSTIFAAIGKKGTITPTVKPETAKDTSIYWESSDESVVKVDKDGNYVGLKTGAATIQATTNDGGYQKSCKIVVYQNAGDTTKSGELLGLINKVRTDAQLSEIPSEDVLQACANQRAYEEGCQGKMDDVRPDGSDYTTIFKDYDMWTRNSKVLISIWGNYTPQQVCDTITKDDQYKKALLAADNTYNYMSVGYYEANGVTYWLVMMAAV